MVAIVNYNFLLAKDLCDLHTERGSDRELQFCIAEDIAHAHQIFSICGRATYISGGLAHRTVAGRMVDGQYLLHLQLTDQVINNLDM